MKRLSTLLSLAAISVAAFAADYSGTLPVLFINTEGGAPILSKETYLHATYYLDNMGIDGVESIGSASQPLGMQIRGRGNYSWSGFDKKPYRIKLDDKQPLLGMDKSKHFALLAHADDTYGFMRNIVGFQLSRMIGMPWTPADAPVEVVLNGDYIGLYFLTETIRVDKNRVNIVEQPDLATDPEEITGGWLVEIDNYDTDPHITINEKDSRHSKIIFTYKTPEELSPAQEKYLTNQVTAINDAIYNPNLNDNSWEDYVDTDILARYYIVQEVVDDYESFHGSCYMYKNIGDCKWMFGPVWDFGNAFSFDKTQYIYQGRVWHNTWIERMCAHPHFMETVQAVWHEFYNNSFNDIYDYVDDYAARISAAARCDAARWPDYGNADIAAKVDIVKNRLRNGAEWLSAQWRPETTYTVYFADNETPAWEQVYAYVWYQVDNYLLFPMGEWPGTELKIDGDTGMYKCEFKLKGDLPGNAMIIFGNGGYGPGNQTSDLEYVPNAIYDRTGVIGNGTFSIADNSPVICVAGSTLMIELSQPAAVTVSDIAGRSTVYNLEPGVNSVELPSGFYIVRSGTSSAKIIIK